MRQKKLGLVNIERFWLSNIWEYEPQHSPEARAHFYFAQASLINYTTGCLVLLCSSGTVRRLHGVTYWKRKDFTIFDWKTWEAKRILNSLAGYNPHLLSIKIHLIYLGSQHLFSNRLLSSERIHILPISIGCNKHFPKILFSKYVCFYPTARQQYKCILELNDCRVGESIEALSKYSYL